jgi:hypothetical protein
VALKKSSMATAILIGVVVALVIGVLIYRASGEGDFVHTLPNLF